MGNNSLLETKDINRSISTSQSELSLYGPKDAFIEDISYNYQLIKRRIKSNDLKYKNIYIGRYTNTKISVLYMEGICRKNIFNSILNRLEKIDIDGIIDSSYLKQYLEEDFHLFPTILMSERPDTSCMSLLEGKVVILVDTSPYALILPSFFFDMIHTTDDYYQKSFHTSFIRVIRLLSFFISIYTPAIYLSITTRNYNIIPLKLLLILKAGRVNVPFPAYIEALLMILCFEILKESDLRMSSKNGSSISILGGLILGDAAVAAGIVSPIMILVIAISSIAGLIFPSIEMGNALRFYKILFLLFATFFGINGVIYSTIYLFLEIITTNIFGYNYFSFSLEDSIFKLSSLIKKRNKELSNNHIRGRYL